MPNWCRNVVDFRHDDPDEIRRLVRAYNEGSLLREFVPNTREDWSWEGCRAIWDVKWDIDPCGYQTAPTDAVRITLEFDTAWNPPWRALEAMRAEGWWIDGHYIDDGHAYPLWGDRMFLEDDWYGEADTLGDLARPTCHDP